MGNSMSVSLEGPINIEGTLLHMDVIAEQYNNNMQGKAEEALIHMIFARPQDMQVSMSAKVRWDNNTTGYARQGQILLLSTTIPMCESVWGDAPTLMRVGRGHNINELNKEINRRRTSPWHDVYASKYAVDEGPNVLQYDTDSYTSAYNGEISPREHAKSADNLFGGYRSGGKVSNAAREVSRSERIPQELDFVVSDRPKLTARPVPNKYRGLSDAEIQHKPRFKYARTGRVSSTKPTLRYPTADEIRSRMREIEGLSYEALKAKHSKKAKQRKRAINSDVEYRSISLPTTPIEDGLITIRNDGEIRITQGGIEKIVKSIEPNCESYTSFMADTSGIESRVSASYGDFTWNGTS